MAVRFILAALFVIATAQSQQLAVDINTLTDPIGIDSNPEGFVAVNGFVYFAATTPDAGRELWRSDGTQNGTERVVDLMPGVASSHPSELTAYQGSLFFVAQTPDAGRELMRTDGTAAGTFVVRDLGLGSLNSSPHDLFVSGNLLYFGAYAAPALFAGFGDEPWVTDGTELGTRFLADLAAGVGSSGPRDFTAHDGFVYFTAEADGVGRELFRTNGTPIGTTLVADLRAGPDGSDPVDLVSFDSSLFFIANDAASGSPDIWRTDGTPGSTSLAIDASTANFPEQLTVFDEALFFVGRLGNNGSELLRSLGTEASTSLVVDIYPGSISGSPSDFTVAGGTLYFTAQAPTSGRELYATDGTAGNTVLLEIAPGLDSAVPTQLTALGSSVVFTLGNGNLDAEPWISDGTPGGTFELADLFAADGSSPHDARLVTPGELWFAAAGTGVGVEIWRTDGTSLGTTLVADVADQPSSAGSDPRDFATLANRVFFGANDGVHGDEPWVSDGTPEGTYLLGDLRTGPSGSGALNFTAVGSRVVFAANGDAGWQLYGTDGTLAGTELIDVAPGGSASDPAGMAVIDGRLFVTLRTDATGREPWVSDGTLAGTASLGDLFPGPSTGSYSGFTPFEGQVLFVGADPDGGAELWTTDGTAAGTAPLIDVLTGPPGSSPDEITPFRDGEFAFLGSSTTDPLNLSRQVWFSDGTQASTNVVIQINGQTPPGSLAQQLTPAGNRVYWRARPFTLDGSQRFHLFASNGKAAGSYTLHAPDVDNHVTDLVALDDRVVFVVSTSDAPDEVWISGGTPATTSLVWSGGEIDAPLVATPGAVFFVENASDESDRLWATDGTPGGTQLVAEPFPDPSVVETIAGVRPLGSGDRVLFAGTDADGGREPWAAGTTAGSGERLADLNPGVPSSNPTDFMRLGDEIVFAADDPLAGREVFSIPMSTTGGWAVDVFGAVCETSSGDPLRLDVEGRAVGGEVLDVGLTGAFDATLAGLYFSFGTATVPLGHCTLHLADPLLVLALVPVTIDGTTTLSLPIPTKASLQGQSFAFQYAIDDPGGPILGIAALSNALEIVIGSD